eukprot:s408_g35.t1
MFVLTSWLDVSVESPLHAPQRGGPLVRVASAAPWKFLWGSRSHWASKVSPGFSWTWSEEKQSGVFVLRGLQERLQHGEGTALSAALQLHI